MAQPVALAAMVLMEALGVMLWAKVPCFQGLTAKQQRTEKRERMPQRRVHPAATALQVRQVKQGVTAHVAKPVAPVWRLTRTAPRAQPLS